MIFKTCLLRRCCYLTYPKHVLDHVITHCLSCNIPKIATLSSVILQESWFFRTRFSQTELKNGPHALSFCLRALLSFSYHSLCVWRKKHKAFALKLLQRINSGAPSHKPKLNLSFFAISFPVGVHSFRSVNPKTLQCIPALTNVTWLPLETLQRLVDSCIEYMVDVHLSAKKRVSTIFVKVPLFQSQEWCGLERIPNAFF